MGWTKRRRNAGQPVVLGSSMSRRGVGENGEVYVKERDSRRKNIAAVCYFIVSSPQLSSQSGLVNKISMCR